MAHENLMVFTGSANPELAMEVVQHLGIPLGKAVVSNGTPEKAEIDQARLHAHGLWATMQKDA